MHNFMPVARQRRPKMGARQKLSLGQSGWSDLKFGLACHRAQYGADPDLMAAAARPSAVDHLS